MVYTKNKEEEPKDNKKRTAGKRGNNPLNKAISDSGSINVKHAKIFSIKIGGKKRFEKIKQRIFA